MSENPILDLFRANLGKPITASPSAVACWLGGTVLAAEEGALDIAYTVRPEMTNPAGKLHGGMIAAMLDDTIGAAAVTLNQRFFYANVNLAVDYLEAADVGDTVIARARFLRRGRRMLNAECRLESPDGRLLARASANLAGLISGGG